MTALGFVVLLLLGMPVAFILLYSAFIFSFVSGNTFVVTNIPQMLFGGLEVFDLLAIPLFILLGEFMNSSGITNRLIAATRLLFGRVPHAIAYVSLTSNLLLASIMGSATAQIAIMSRVMVPEMEKDGYSRSFSTALTAASGMLGPVIPPSMIFIIYSVVAQVSVADMFLAGLAPGALLFFLYVLVIIRRAPKSLSKKEEGPKQSNSAQERGFGKRVLVDAAAGLTIPLVIIFGISMGIVTSTESAALAITIALLISIFLYRTFDIRNVSQMLIRTALNSGMVLIMISTAKVFGWVLTYAQVPQTLALQLQMLTTSPTIFLLLVFLLCMLIGAVLDGMAALIIIVPIILPIAVSSYGIDPIHFGIVVSMTLTVGLLTPPVGTGLFIASAVADIDFVDLVRHVLPYIVMTSLCIIIVVLFPSITAFMR
ncbi:TRAP transporter large permease [Halomonas sp. AOP42-C1-46]|uniref:TRAP transporter large permease n=1 Tax=Halomonas sp. AOP42-C1-46 TaxID=3457671 RepID=UPI004034BDE7